MNNPKLKLSELIKPCCGTLLDVPSHRLVEMAEQLEADNERLISEVQRLEKNRFGVWVLFWIMLGCFYVWVFW